MSHIGANSFGIFDFDVPHDWGPGPSMAVNDFAVGTLGGGHIYNFYVHHPIRFSQVRPPGAKRWGTEHKEFQRKYFRRFMQMNSDVADMPVESNRVEIDPTLRDAWGIPALRVTHSLTNHQLGVILSPAFWGFTVSIMLGGSLVDFIGMRRLFLMSSAGYIAAVLLVLIAPAPPAPVTRYYADTGFVCLYVGFLMLGLSQGLVEGVINPLCATMYPEDKTAKFNILHAWWPGGLIIGGLAAYGLTRALGLDAPDLTREASAFGWRLKLALLMLPAIIYAVMSIGQRFPETERVSAGVSHAAMFREALRPMFLLWFVLMWLTAATELGPSQWVPSLITNLTACRAS